jgi:ribose transport system substrate-binding protein
MLGRLISRIRAWARSGPTPRLVLVACLALGVALLLGVAGCGSSSSSSSESSSSESSETGESPESEESAESSFLSASAKEKIDAEVAKLEERPTHIGPTEKITKPVPKGKTIDVVHCSVEGCTGELPYFEAAGEALGWKVVPVEAGLTAETIKNAWEQVVKNKPDGVISVAESVSGYSTQLAELKEMEIPVVNEYASGDPAGSNGIINPVIFGNEYFVEQGETLGKYILANATETVKAVMFKSDHFPNNVLMSEGFKSEIEKECSECEVAFDEIPITAVGTNALPPQIASYFQAHPETNWGYPAWTDLITGVPAAMRGAGVSGKASFVTLQAGGAAPAANSYLENGEELVAMVHVPGQDGQWQCMDELARYFTGTSTKADEPTTSSTWIVTQKVMEEEELGQFEGNYPAVAEFEKQFKELWGVS